MKTKSKMDDYTLFCKLFKKLGITPAEFARFYALKNNPINSDVCKISDKLNGNRGVIKADIALIQCVQLIKDLGVDLNSVEFNNNSMIDINKVLQSSIAA